MSTIQRPRLDGILLTDQYQLTMAQLYYRLGLHETPALFDHFFRHYPNYGAHRAGYCIAAGLEWLLEWMQTTHFEQADIDYLRGVTSRTGKPLFSKNFLKWLGRAGNFEGLSVRAIPEGRVVHPNVPLTSVEGPLAMAQILETALLNQLNYQTLIATKAARIRESGLGRMLMEFGLRRAPGAGANAGARAALIGGCDFTSNVAVSSALGLPPKGTHAHSLVQIFMAQGGGELEAFRAYADSYPDDCLLLVDTINTLESGVPNAIRVFEELRQRGHEPVGVRLDSGDLAHLSIQVARELDRAGFPEAVIVLSNQLDELVIWQIVTQIREEAPRYGVEAEALLQRLVYGVGTRLITSAGDSALDGVYKLVALKSGGQWVPAIKISETPTKTVNPGLKTAWRLYDVRGKATADVVALAAEDLSAAREVQLRHPTDHAKRRTLTSAELSEVEPLQVEVFCQGERVGERPTLAKMRARRQRDLDRLDPGTRRLMNPHIYHVSLSQRLWELKHELAESHGSTTASPPRAI